MGAKSEEGEDEGKEVALGRRDEDEGRWVELVEEDEAGWVEEHRAEELVGLEGERDSSI